MVTTLKVKELKAGMVLSSSVKTKSGQLIAKAGTVLNRSLIQRITFYKIKEVHVDTTMDIPMEDKHPSEQPMKKEHSTVDDIVSYNKKLLHTDAFHNFQLNYTRTLEKLKCLFTEIQQKQTYTQADDVLQSCSKLFQSKTSLELFSMVFAMRSLEDSVFAHSLNVALISHTIGKWLKRSAADLEQLTLAGLLHDIGKLTIPEEVLNKTTPLSQEEFALIRRHPLEGNKLLKRAGLNPWICNAALQHHERFDGSGYPRNLTEDEIDDFASIIAIADVYDAMTAARSYRTARCAFQVIYEFEQDGLQKYNTRYILTFLERIANLYQNSQVMLSDGRNAKVVYVNKGALSRPIVELNDKMILDLSHHRDVVITAIV